MKKLLSIVLLIICSVNLWANVAAPSQGGNILTEPNGIKTIDITNENLTIDFTQLGDENLPLNERYIEVEAIYEVNNPADIPKLELIFVILSEAKGFQFFLDDKEISAVPFDNKNFADRNTWKTPTDTPFEDRKIMYNPSNGNLKSAKFTLNLAKGKHFLKAKYRAVSTIYRNIGLMKGWQFAYSLAPARDWKSFGGLNLNIKVPTDWKFFANIKLERNGDNLTGKFTEIPADFLAVTTQAPIPANYTSTADLYFLILLVCLFGFPFLLIIIAVWKGYKWKYAWAYGFLFGILWAGLVALSGYFNQFGAVELIPKSQYTSYGYGEGFAVLFLIILVPIVLVIGILLWIGTVLVAGKIFKKA
ncbi:MAG TPA: hypothetical protein PKY82_07420 [Pyrinomonadaceae bacterium]|nr:hypothetical protein [Pyrinomonadaceae bacterium]